MTVKKIFLVGISVTTLAGLFAAAGNRLSTHRTPAPVGLAMPPAEEEYRRIMERFSGADSIIDMSGTIRIYDGENKFAFKEQRTFRYTRSGPQYYAQLSRLQTFCDGRMVLQLDTLNKSISVSAVRTDVPASVNPGVLPFDRLFSDSGSFKINAAVSRQGAEGNLRMQSDFNPEIKSCTLYYDTTTYRLHRAEVEFWKQAMPDGATPNRIWLAKIDYRYQAPRALDMGKMISVMIFVTNGQVGLTSPYKDYQIHTRF